MTRTRPSGRKASLLEWVLDAETDPNVRLLRMLTTDPSDLPERLWTLAARFAGRDKLPESPAEYDRLPVRSKLVAWLGNQVHEVDFQSLRRRFR